MSLQIFHNPRCSKSRQTLALLEEKGLSPEVIEYLKTPPDAATLDRVLTLLDMQPRALMRRKEAAYATCGADDADLSRQALITLMVENPVLIERPIVVHDGRAAIGRPPENVLQIL